MAAAASGTHHTVAQGEHLSQIARKYGLASYRAIWDHAENARLKSERQNPNVLLPGDRLYVPSAEPKQESAATGQRARFRLERPRLVLRVVLDELYGSPLANAECELHVDGQVFHLTTDDRGRLEHEIPETAQEAVLIVRTGASPIAGTPLKLQIGHLDPVDQRSGQVARLANLGYYTRALDEIDDRELAGALQQFQLHAGLAVDGVCGPATQAKLKQVHGS
jgi:N-acetylmuramoyl-L-alanine amidase